MLCPDWFQLCLVNLPVLWYLRLFPFVFVSVLSGPFSLCALSFSPQLLDLVTSDFHPYSDP